jgi:phage terminase large subunit-like protein
MDRKKFDKKKFPFCDKGHNYAIDIVEGKIVASKYVKGACQRYLNDLENKKANFYFNSDAAEKFLRLAQKFDHVIGQWDTPNIVFEPWQCWVWMTIMGFINKDTKFRRFRMAHLEVARGNAKSAMASQAGLYFLALDDPNGNQISTVATKKEQARIVLDSSRNMAKKSQSFLQGTGVKVLAHSITHPPSNSMMRALSSEHSGLDGLNDVLAICDELHAMRAEVFDVITSGMSKRKDSLTLCITTAGFDEDSVGYSQSIYAKKVAIGEVQDDQFFSVVYTLDDGDDWADESVWIKANPNLGVSVDPVTLKAKVEKAIITPRDIKNVKVKHMNLWISEASAFYDQKKWDACANPTLRMEDFLHLPCRLGIDLASHIDITSIATVFRDRRDKEEKYYIFDRSYIPEGTVKEVRSPLYDDCISKGFLIQTKGEAINYDFIEEEARDIAKRYRVQECLYDTWNATAMAQKLSGNIEMVKIAMNVANFSEPMKKLDALIRQGKVVHNGSPLLRWCLGNVVAKEDHNGNVYPRKSHVRLKIDPIVAILMALAGWLQDESKESIYEERGVLTI